jgi:ubiquinone/menaquinone biosynthesis C-methylase UbiE
MPSQFGAPKGARGWLAAQVVARLTGEANRWMVDCLGVAPEDRMLDVGCGPGLAVAYAAEIRGARVVGVDASEVMVRQALRRNRRAIRDGRVRIHRADAADLPFADGAFTAVGSLNSLQFWPAPEKGLAELKRVVAPGGRVAVVLMARRDDPEGPAAPAWFEATVDLMLRVGLEDVGEASRTFGGVLHRAVLGRRAPEGRTAPHSTPRRTG